MPKQKARRAFEPMWVTMPSKQRGKHTFIEVPNNFAFYVMWMIFAQPPRRGVSRADIDAAVFVRSKKMLLSKQPTAYDKELATIRCTMTPEDRHEHSAWSFWHARLRHYFPEDPAPTCATVDVHEFVTAFIQAIFSQSEFTHIVHPEDIQTDVMHACGLLKDVFRYDSARSVDPELVRCYDAVVYRIGCIVQQCVDRGEM
jgi:hypothetical protein